MSKNKKGEPKENHIGYYTTIASALEGLLKKHYRIAINEKDITLKEALEEFRKIKDDITKNIQY